MSRCLSLSRRPAGLALAFLIASPLAAAETKLTVATPSWCVGPAFGSSVAISGEALHADRLIVGSPGYDGTSVEYADAGYVNLFEVGADGWVATASKGFPEAANIPTHEGARFGQSVAMWAGLALAGAPYLHIRISGVTQENAGGSLLLERVAWGNWNGLGDNRNGSEASENLGYAVALQDTSFYVDGAPGYPVSETQIGRAQIPELVGGVWFDGDALVAPDAGGSFGQSVATWGGRVAVGAPTDAHAAAGAGAVYVFHNGGGTWHFEQKLTASDLAAGDAFGYAVSMSGSYLVAGAPGKNSSRGRVYVFQLSGSTWSQVANLSASDGQAGDALGSSVASWDPYLVVGAPGDDDNGANAGAAYGFGRGAGGYAQAGKRNAGDGWPNDEYGSSVSIYNGDFAVGAPLAEVGGKASAGAVYVYEWSDLDGHIFSDGFERGNGSRWSSTSP